MAAQQQSNSGGTWTGTQAYVFAVICLVVGVAIGYLVRGSATPTATMPAAQATGSPAAMGMGSSQQPTADQMKHMAEKQAEPLLAQLKTKPNDPQLLYQVGNVYYDTQNYPEAISYYDQSLKANPNSPDVRTDMATAYFYSGDVDKALSELAAVLKSNPTHANALFNQGMIMWKGKMDINGAVTAWKKLLETNPNYDRKEEVQAFITQAEKHANIKPGQKTDKPAGL